MFDEAFLDERLECVKAGVADCLRGLECRAAGEDRESCKERLLRIAEQVVAPFDRRPQCRLAGVRIAAALE